MFSIAGWKEEDDNARHKPPTACPSRKGDGICQKSSATCRKCPFYELHRKEEERRTGDEHAIRFGSSTGWWKNVLLATLEKLAGNERGE